MLGFANPNGTRNIDFDTMEVENASKTSDLKFARRMRRDWLSFLKSPFLIRCVSLRFVERGDPGRMLNL